jgi:hypothetical protein
MQLQKLFLGSGLARFASAPGMTIQKDHDSGANDFGAGLTT